MRRFVCFCTVVFAVMSVFFCGCSNPEEEKAKANAALRAEVQEILDSLQVVDKSMLSAVDRGDILNSEIMLMLDKFKRLSEITGLVFYSWVLSEPNTPYFSEEQYQKLTVNHPKLIPFYVEDEMSGTIYFAPPPEQEFIIEKYKEWFAKNGAAFDFDAVQKAYKNQK